MIEIYKIFNLRTVFGQLKLFKTTNWASIVVNNQKTLNYNPLKLSTNEQPTNVKPSAEISN